MVPLAIIILARTAINALLATHLDQVDPAVATRATHVNAVVKVVVVDFVTVLDQLAPHLFCVVSWCRSRSSLAG